MTDTQIKEQIELIKKVTKEASKTPETARQFLIDAGILKNKSKINEKFKTSTKRTKPNN